MSAVETLTKQERAFVSGAGLSVECRAGEKALRIIDRAESQLPQLKAALSSVADKNVALVAQLEAARAALVEAQTVGVFCSGDEDERPRLRAQVAELTRERVQLTEAIEATRARAAEDRLALRAEVTRLTRERDEARVECEKHRQMSISARMLLAEDQALESKVTRLTEALAAQFDLTQRSQRLLIETGARLGAAEARVQELEAAMAAMAATHGSKK